MDIARFIDHTLLAPEATPDDVRTLCEEAVAFGFAGVCVNQSFVAQSAEITAGTDVRVCTVAGFPLGASATAAKVAEAAGAVRNGAREIDMVLHVGMLRAGEHAYVRGDIEQVAAVVHDAGAILKVILETALLSEIEKVTACRICRDAGADFVKTSTGFSRGGATAADVRLMREAVGPDMGVKAAGGIRTRPDAESMIASGASRIGTSAGVAIVRGSSEPAEGGY
jgi:deoxyribose-phosphate aldolase